MKMHIMKALVAAGAAGALTVPCLTGTGGAAAAAAAPSPVQAGRTVPIASLRVRGSFQWPPPASRPSPEMSRSAAPAAPLATHAGADAERSAGGLPRGRGSGIRVNGHLMWTAIAGRTWYPVRF